MLTNSERSGPGPETIAVVGLGLMGGSLCRALKSTVNPPRIIGLDTNSLAGAAALNAGAIDEFESGEGGGLEAVDVAIYAAPLRATFSLIRRHVGLWRDDVLLTDVVSLQEPVLKASAASGVGDRFVAGHPICGGEMSGFGASRSGLFRDATVWLSAGDEVASELRVAAEAFWSSVGGAPRWVAAADHDQRMSWVSHLPQLVANALAGALDAAGCTPDELGPGGRDMTRLAGSNPEIWKDLLHASAATTGTGLTSMSKALNVLADLMARREIDRIAEFMERTRKWSTSE